MDRIFYQQKNNKKDVIGIDKNFKFTELIIILNHKFMSEYVLEQYQFFFLRHSAI